MVSACDTAVMVKSAGVGTEAGAVYRPLLEMVPNSALPPEIPLTDQATVVLPVFETVALNCWVNPIWIVADVG